MTSRRYSFTFTYGLPLSVTFVRPDQAAAPCTLPAGGSNYLQSRFDEGCLRAVFAAYEIAYPCYEFRDTLYASRQHFGNLLENHQLHTVSAACGYDLTNHHHALADAEACAWIAREIV